MIFKRRIKELEFAKIMYFQYRCNGFYMWKEGVDKVYKKYRVPRKLEVEWTNEYIKGLFKAIEDSSKIDSKIMSVNFLNLFDITQNNDFANIQRIYDLFLEKYDSLDILTKVMICEGLMNYLNDWFLLKINSNLLRSILNKLINQILKTKVNESATTSSQHIESRFGNKSYKEINERLERLIELSKEINIGITNCL